jgi:uncharacterized protein YndB with AHSA1/START domain
MSLNACPIATVDAPVERVWSLLADPHQYSLWWDAQTLSIEPDGPAQPGQVIHAQSRALGRWWDVITSRVERVDPGSHQINLTTSLPLGITVHNTITCVALNPNSCRLSFG